MKTRRMLKVVLFITLLLLLSTSCNADKQTKTPGEVVKEDKLIRIARDYKKDGDLKQAEKELRSQGIDDPEWIGEVVKKHVAYKDLAAEDLRALAELARDLGVENPAVSTALGTATPTQTPIVSPTITVNLLLPAPTGTKKSPAPTQTATNTPAATTAPTPTKPYVVARGLTNIRSGPGVNYPPIGFLVEGQQAPIVKQYLDWWEICCWKEGMETKGWIFKGVIDTKGPVENIPEETIIPPTPTPGAAIGPVPTTTSP